jgi:hypothetical protein
LRDGSHGALEIDAGGLRFTGSVPYGTWQFRNSMQRPDV